MNLKCVIVDDDQYAVDALVGYIKKLPQLTVHQTFTKSVLALTEIKASDEIDVIFLDIEMPEISGLDLAKNLRDKTKFLIFTTSHANYALTAYGLNANQYLLKPITFSKFALAIDFLAESIATNAKIIESSAHTSNPQKNKLQFVKADQRYSYHYINPLEITYVQASGNDVVIFTSTEKFNARMGLNHVEKSLSKAYFIRISKSFIIAKSAIKRIDGQTVKLNNDQVFPLGKTYRDSFFEFVNKEMMKADDGSDYQLD